MKTKFLNFIIVSIFFIPMSLFAQWEFQYFVLKFGVNHHAFSHQPDTNSVLFLHTFEGEKPLYPDSAFFPDYMPGFNAGFDFHFDFTNDMGGIVIGAHYNTSAFSSKYITADGKYSVIQKYRIHSLSFPFYVKFGREIFDQQKYFTAGFKYNVNFTMQICDNVNWLERSVRMKAEKNMFLPSNVVLFGGFNFFIFNFEFDFYLQNFLNTAYSLNVGTINDKFIAYPFEGQPSKLMFVYTNITIPLSPWTTNKSYFMNRLFRIFK